MLSKEIQFRLIFFIESFNSIRSVKCINVNFSEMLFCISTTQDWAFVKFDNDQMSFCIKNGTSYWCDRPHVQGFESHQEEITGEFTKNKLIFTFRPLPTLVVILPKKLYSGSIDNKRKAWSDPALLSLWRYCEADAKYKQCRTCPTRVRGNVSALNLQYQWKCKSVTEKISYLLFTM